MRVRPLHDRILVRRLEEGEQTIGGIIIPDTAREKPQQGEILAVGNGKLNDQGRRFPLEVKVGDRILFDKYSQEIALEGEEYLILRQEEVLAVLGGGRTTRKTTTKKNTKSKMPATKIRTKSTKKGTKKTKKTKKK